VSGAPDRDHDSAAEALWYSESGAARAARGLLSPLSALFSAAASARSALYRHRILPSSKAPAPVVSVGGLSVGGSGKTPLVLWLAGRLREEGRRPCIVTRGYGRNSPTDMAFLLTASDAAGPDAVERAGDEAVLLALRSACPVAVGADRLQACELAAASLAGTPAAPDVFLLDDGFQHRRLARDLDIVLVSGLESSQKSLPAGPLREGVAALSRAGVVVVMGQGGPTTVATEFDGVPASRGAAVMLETLRFTGGAGPVVVHASTRARWLVAAVTDDDGDSPTALAGRSVVAVAAIARPQRFLADLQRSGARVVASVLRRDHHRYDDADRRAIDAAAAHADLVVTTEKDLVKLAGLGLAAPLRALRIEVCVDSDEEQGRLLERVRAAFDR